MAYAAVGMLVVFEGILRGEVHVCAVIHLHHPRRIVDHRIGRIGRGLAVQGSHILGAVIVHIFDPAGQKRRRQ